MMPGSSSATGFSGDHHDPRPVVLEPLRFPRAPFSRQRAPVAVQSPVRYAAAGLRAREPSKNKLWPTMTTKPKERTMFQVIKHSFRAALAAVAVVSLSMASAPIQAQSCTTSVMGSTSYHSCSNGLSGTSTRLGGTTFHSYSDGTSGTSSRLGGTTFHSYSDGTSGTSSRLGGTTFHSYSDGTSGTSSRLGGTTFHSYSDGTSGTSTRMGGTTFHSW